MRTKTTLRTAVKFVKNCKSIFSFKKVIYKKNIFSLLHISFSPTASFDAILIENKGNIRSIPSYKNARFLISDNTGFRLALKTLRT
jgi:hypothetical protein